MADPHLKTGGELLSPSVRVAADKVDPSCMDEFKKLKIRRKYRYIIYRIEAETIVIDRLGERDEDLAALKAALPASECRFVLYDHEFTTADGRKPSKLFFLCWNPSPAPPYLKMSYTTAKPLLRDNMQGVFDVLAQSADEIESAFGIETEEDEDSDIDI